MAFTNTYLKREIISGIEYGLILTTGVTADVNGLGTQFEIVPAVSGKVIRVRNAWISKSGAAVHATSTTLWWLTDTATAPQALSAESLLSSVATTYPCTMNAGGWGATDTIMIVSKGLFLRTSNSVNPSAGTAAAAFNVFTEYLMYVR